MGAPSVRWRRRALKDGCPAVAVLAVLAVAACGRPTGGDDRWAVVQEYIEQRAAWDEQSGDARDMADIWAGGGTPEELLRRTQEAYGALPDAAVADAAAREIVAEGGLRTADAAAFLIGRWGGVVGLLERAQRASELVREGVDPVEARARHEAEEERTWAALIEHSEPDWAVVQDYVEAQEAWIARRVMEAGLLGSSRPSAVRALATAQAILGLDGTHQRTIEAAEFLVDVDPGVPRWDWHVAAGARALLAHAPDFEWARVLRPLDRAGGVLDGQESPLQAFLEETASTADDPLLRAAARYHLAARLVRAANAPMLSPDDRAALVDRALDQATGLSAGLEDETFGEAAPRSGHGPARASRTFVQAEADLLSRIRHSTVGGTLPGWTGRRLDGTQEPLSAYRGRVLLIDWWATWCRPCIDALPALRDMVADLPADRFALLTVSVDEDLATVTEFLEAEPMPWNNWHVGVSSELERLLDVRGFPTYVLADEDGTILARGNAPVAQWRCLAEKAVAGEDPECSPEDWIDGR